jgi:hydroxyethylthiazole kinase-like uncharacterized protein yjeF
MKLYSPKTSKEIDHCFIHNEQINSFELMKRAAFQSWQIADRLYPDVEHVYIFCGSGNNAGDGLLFAQYAKLSTKKVTVIKTSQRCFQGDALNAWNEWHQLGYDSVNLKDFELEQIQDEDLIVDAIFGTGFKGTLDCESVNLITKINQQFHQICALDCPSGLNTKTGCAQPIAFKAEHTFTFLTQKIGLYSVEGPDYCGQIHLLELNTPAHILDQFKPEAESRSRQYWLQQLPIRIASTHKGQCGRSLIIGGNHQMIGALIMAGEASIQSGAGYTQIMTHQEYFNSLVCRHPEFMCIKTTQLTACLERTDAIAVGPGLGQDDWAQSLFDQTLNKRQSPLVLDADALNLLAQSPLYHDDWILTPHPTEAARLLNCRTEDVQADRIKAIHSLQKTYGGVVVLKGNGTLIYDGNHLEICLAGNPGMATAGMGDVLTGIITSLLAQKMPLMAASCLGVYLHAEAADSLYQQTGFARVTPSNVIDAIAPNLQR